jgi:hypothetical protein
MVEFHVHVSQPNGFLKSCLAKFFLMFENPRAEKCIVRFLEIFAPVVW